MPTTKSRKPSSKTKSVKSDTASEKPASAKSSVRKAKSPKNSTKSKTSSSDKATTTRKKKTTAKEAAQSIDANVQPHALNDEMNEKVRELIHLSREQGYLTFKDVDKSLPEIATQPEELQNVISIFNNLEIKLLDSAEVDKFKKKKRKKAKKKKHARIKAICSTILFECILSKWVKFLF